jgi:hypothetical protein
MKRRIFFNSDIVSFSMVRTLRYGVQTVQRAVPTLKMTHYFNSALAVAVAGILTGCWTPPNANVQPMGKPGLIQGGIPVEIIQEPVTVAAIDAGQRTITLKRDDGTTKTFTAGETVKNLDQVKVGGQIKAVVKAELSVYILDNGRLPNADGTTRPKTINFNAKVLQVDPSYRLLTLQFSNGHTLTIKAGLNVMLEKMAPGDDVVMRSSQITAITIKKP